MGRQFFILFLSKFCFLIKCVTLADFIMTGKTAIGQRKIHNICNGRDKYISAVFDQPCWGSHTDARILLQPWGWNSSQAHSWEAECASRFLVSQGSDSALGCFFRSVRHQVHQMQTCLPQIRITSFQFMCYLSRPSSSGLGCTVNPLEGNLGICLPSNIHPSTDLEQGQVRGLQDHVDCSSASEGVVV